MDGAASQVHTGKSMHMCMVGAGVDVRVCGEGRKPETRGLDSKETGPNAEPRGSNEEASGN